MISRAKDTHTPNRVVRVDDELWDDFGKAAGTRNRGEVLREFMRWYVHRKGVTRPDRPVRRDDSE